MLSRSPEKPKWTFIQNKSQSRDVRYRKLDVGKYSFTDCRLGEALEQNPERYIASRSRKILDAWLEHIVTCLQVCRQYPAAREMYMPQSEGRVFIASRDCPRQRLHSDFENVPWNEENEERPHGMEAKSQAAEYFVMVSRRAEMPLWIFEGSH